MSLISNALTTVERASDWMELSTTPVSGSAKFNKIERLINSITTFIENYTGLRFKKTTYTNEEYDTEKGQVITLKNYPVVSGESFTLQRRNSQLNEDDWETVDSQIYFVDEDAGIIRAAGGSTFERSRRGFRVTYTAGYDFNLTSTFLSDTDAGDIEVACWMLIAATFERGAGGGGVKQEKIGDYSVTYQKSLFENDDIKAILDKYAGDDLQGALTPLQSI